MQLLAGDDSRADEIAPLLLEQALLAEGGELADPGAYVRRANDLIVRLLGGSDTK